MDDESGNDEIRTETLDLSDEEMAEMREKRKAGDLSVDDIQDEEIREAVKKSRGDDIDELREQAAEAESVVELQDDPVDEEDDFVTDYGQKMEEIAEKATEAEENAAGMDHPTTDVSEDDDPDTDADGLLDDLDDDEIEGMFTESTQLNVRDDIDPEHFDYENQEFEQFGAYGQQVTVEFKGALFLFEQPNDRAQQRLLNDMQTSTFAGEDPTQMTREQAMQQMSMSDMMESMIEHTIVRPENIADLAQDWSSFDRFGLGLLCMEFLGLDALGNI